MSELVIPDGFATGCLPRESLPGQWCPLAASRMDVIPRSEWAGLIGKVNLRKRVNHIKNQTDVGSCATESTAQAVEIGRDSCGFEWVKLNPWFVYQTTSGGSDRGSSIDANLRFVREYGVAPESIWPRSRGWRTRPSAEAYEAALQFRIEEFWDCTRIDEVGTALLLGFPVVFGWSGHSCVFTRLLDPDTAEYANSWSPQWGDAGFGKLSLRSINFNYGAFIVRVPTFNP